VKSSLHSQTFNSQLNPFYSSIICQLPTPELSIQFSAASANYLVVISSQSSSTADFLESESESYIMSDCQSASLSCNKAPVWGLRPNFYYCQTFEDLLMCGSLSLWREDGSVVYNYPWPSPSQSFSSPNPVGLMTTFHSLTFETSIFVASYNSQGYGGGIRPRLYTGITATANWTWL
jgi:hypothetical protein